MARRKKPKIVYLDGPETESPEALWESTPPEAETPATELRESVGEVMPSELRDPTGKFVPPEVSPSSREIPPKKIEIPAEASVEAAEAPAENDEHFDAEPAEDQAATAAPVQVKPVRKQPSWVLSAAFGVVMLVVLAAFIFIPLDEEALAGPPKPQAPNCLNIHPNVDWGYEFHTLTCSEGVMEEGRTIADILLSRRVDYKTIIELTENAARQGLPEMRPGNTYTILQPKNEPMRPHLLAYAPDAAQYVLMNLEGTPEVTLYERKLLESAMKQGEVAIQTNLAEAMYNREFGLKLARAMETALKYKLDFFHLDPGDRFSLLYQESQYEGNKKAIGGLEAVRYRHKGEEGYAFWFQDEYVKGFYDRDGRPMRSGFLKAPLEYGRISSPFNRRRPDPVSGSGKIMPHLGTDYAAPTGTPILAVADGVVMKAEFKGGNGNYVKLLHSKEVQTQYLHMRNFAPGIKPGVEVRQGEVIGFVGSTGRSTGPHVCFRYWKNGEQVDHRKEKNLGPAPALKGTSFNKFELRRDSLMRIFEPV